MRHLQIKTFGSSDVLDAANHRRKVLDLPSLEKLEANTKLDEGVAKADKPQTSTSSPRSAS